MAINFDNAVNKNKKAVIGASFGKEDTGGVCAVMAKGKCETVSSFKEEYVSAYMNVLG